MARVFTEREKAALAYARAATDPRTPVDDACRARLRAQFDPAGELHRTTRGDHDR
jgi:alkylhydroperoxidase family enzyme